MPLFWTERKPVSFWNDILFCLDAKMVVDMSPGSGVVGRAAMKAGIKYVAACRNEVHAAWLSSILDQEVCAESSPLFEQDMAVMIETHFADVLAQNSERDQAQDRAFDEESHSY